MKIRSAFAATLVFTALSASFAEAARIVPSGEPTAMLIPVTPFANMASGHQATNAGFQAILKDSQGGVVASGPMTLDALMSGYEDDASAGTAYGRLVLNVALTRTAGTVAAGEHRGRLSICMTESTRAATCRRLGGNIHPERPFEWFDKDVSYVAQDGSIRITRYYGNTGEGGSPQQLALVTHHPAYAFAVPGKAFKDFQSPLVLDMSGSDELDLVDVWEDSRPVNFDLSGSGIKRRTGWIGPRAAFLALDANRNAKIDDGSELFGEYTRLDQNIGPGSKTFANGFLALETLDSNHDGRIDALDKRFSELVLWRDLDVDGICDDGELATLGESDVTSVFLGYEKATGAHASGNEAPLASRFQKADGSSGVIADVWFKQRRRAGLDERQKAEIKAEPASEPRRDYGMNVTNRRPVDSVSDFLTAAAYATDHVYVTNNLRPGMQVLFSASYGEGGEAGQSRGVLVEGMGGGLYYKQLANPTRQLLLPPGLAFGADSGVSLWEMRSYLDLVNSVALRNGPQTLDGRQGSYGRVGANVVDFRAGTAGRQVAYRDALELELDRQTGDGRSIVRVYYAKGVGPVALEFVENTSPSGTFKVYFGDAAD